MEILFKNKTVTTVENIKRIKKYTKSYPRCIVNIFKICICIFIIAVSLVMVVKEKEGISAIYILFAAWGIKDTIFQTPRIGKIIIYEFYISYFIMKNEENSLKIGYDQIMKIEEDERNYYIIFHTKCGIFLDKSCFSIGDEKRHKIIYTRKNS